MPGDDEASGASNWPESALTRPKFMKAFARDLGLVDGFKG